MKYNINNLYFAKCRHCIMDIINVTDKEGHIISPHPDYVDYYTILSLSQHFLAQGASSTIHPDHIKSMLNGRSIDYGHIL